MSDRPVSWGPRLQHSNPPTSASRRARTRHIRPASGAAAASVLAAVAMIASACSSSGGSNGSTTTSATGNAGTGSPASGSGIQALYAQAKKEGQVTEYASLAEDEATAIASQFEKKYPGIKVHVVYLTGHLTVTRIEAEAKGGQHVADVIEGGNQPILLQQAGLVDQSFQAPDAPTQTYGLKLPKGIYTDRLQVNTISYNPSVLKQDGLPVPTGFSDFTDPKWKGKFSIDPTTADVVDSLGTTEGYDTILALMKKIGANKPLFVTSHSLASSQVASGAVVAALNTYGYKAASYKKKNPTTTDFVVPNPTPVGVSEIGVVKNAPDPAAAKLFVNWVVSKEGQEAYLQQGTVSIRTDVPNNPALWNPQKNKPSFDDPTRSTADTTKLLNEYRAAIGYKGE